MGEGRCAFAMKYRHGMFREITALENIPSLKYCCRMLVSVYWEFCLNMGRKWIGDRGGLVGEVDF